MYTAMIMVGSQLMALLLTVLISPLNRFSTSPLEYRFRASQSASMILSKISAWISLLISMLSFADRRLMTLLKIRLNTEPPTMIRSISHRRLVS